MEQNIPWAVSTKNIQHNNIENIDSDTNSGETDEGLTTSIIRVPVQNKFSNVLIDSGATNSVCDFGYANKLGVKIEPLPHDAICRYMIVADRARIPILGIVRLLLDVGKINIEHPFYVMKGCSNPVIIGMDFICRNKVICNHANGFVSFRNGLTSIPFVKERSYIGIARLIGDEVIPPFRQKQVAVNIKTNRNSNSSDEQGLFTPLGHLPNQLSILPLVCSTHVSPMMIMVRNLSYRPIRLKRYGPLCTVARV